MPATAFHLTQLDTYPMLEAQLTDPDDEPVDLGGADVELHVAEPRGGDVVVDDPVTVVDAGAGRVRYQFDESDTARSGRYRAEFVVTFPNGATSTYPNDGAETIFIDAALAP